jgi:surface protein
MWISRRASKSEGSDSRLKLHFSVSAGSWTGLCTQYRMVCDPFRRSVDSIDRGSRQHGGESQADLCEHFPWQRFEKTEKAMTDKRERTTGLLPPDSHELFANGELQEHNFAQSSFTEDDVGTSVTECDLTNVDTSSVETMEGMFYEAESFNQDIGNWDTSHVQDMRGMFFRAESFDQDISAWCVEQITQKPSSFDACAGFEGVNTKQPNWGDAY